MAIMAASYDVGSLKTWPNNHPLVCCDAPRHKKKKQKIKLNVSMTQLWGYSCIGRAMVCDTQN
jgi:hypothetical protein